MRSQWVKCHFSRTVMGIIGLLVVIQLTGCFATSNYYTGKTAEQGDKVITAGFDNIVIQDTETGEIAKMDMPFTPTFGLAFGLPLRFELGLRWYFLRTLEADLRWQATPRSFKPFNLSLNLHAGLWEFETSYLKYGATISKEIRKFEPALSFYEYEYRGSFDLEEELFGDGSHDFRVKTQVLSLGLAYHVPHAILIPEANYQYSPGHINAGVIYYGLGIRIISPKK